MTTTHVYDFAISKIKRQNTENASKFLRKHNLQFNQLKKSHKSKLISLTTDLKQINEELHHEYKTNMKKMEVSQGNFKEQAKFLKNKLKVRNDEIKNLKTIVINLR